MKILKYIGPFLIFIILLVSCSENYTPKPRGYFRITLPEKKYTKYDENIPFSFEIPQYSIVQIDSSRVNDGWRDILFPTMKGQIHLSYINIDKDLAKCIEDSRTLAYKHTIKAEAINEEVFVNKDENVYGVLYEIKGNVASSYQFFVTDSTEHFLRGALYFNVYPNKDSLAPILDFVKMDIVKLMETVKWKK